MVDYKYSDLFWKGSVDKQWRIEYDDGVIANGDLFSQSIEISESLCSESELKFGCCEASSLKFKVANIVQPLINKWLTVSVVLDHHGNEPFVIGRYKVASDKVTSDRQHREIVAYDAMYDIINTDVSEWYKSLNFPLNINTFRHLFLMHFGIEWVGGDKNLVNDDMAVEKTIEPEQLSGKDVITAICEINGCFGHIGRDGKFHYIYLRPNIQGLYPSDDLFPDHAPDYLPQAKTGHLYPQNPESTRIDIGNYIECNCEDFVTKKIDKLQIRQEENDIGAVVGTGDNCYIIEDNFLVYGKPAEQLQEAARNIYEKIHEVVYRPFDCDSVGNPCLEVGDSIRIPTRYEIVESYVLNRTLKGIQALRDGLKADGVETYGEKVNSVGKSIIQLKGKTNTLERTVEETKSTISDVEKGLQSQITQTAESISLEVSQREEGQKELSSRIEQTAKGISLEVNNGEKSAGIVIKMVNEKGEQIGDDVTGTIEMTGMVTFKSLSDDGTTDINGSNITTGRVNGERIDTKTLYLEDGVKMHTVDSNGGDHYRTVMWMEYIPEQLLPNLVIGNKTWSTNIVLKNSLNCEGEVYAEEAIYARNMIYAEKNIRLIGDGEQGVSALGADESMYYIISYNPDTKHTIVGMPESSSKETSTRLRGSTVVLESAGSVTTSDERLKNSFKPLDEFDAVYMDIETYAFKYNNGTSGRYHFGAKAQDVKKAFEEHGYTTQDFGGFVQMEDNPGNEDYCGIDDPMGLIYTEFTMWNMHMVQKLYKKIEEQQKEIDSLKESISFLLERM